MKYSLAELNEMTRVRFVGALGTIYELSPWIAEETWDRRPFENLADLHRAMEETVERAGETRQLALLKAHPDLAGKAARAGALTDHSTGEQASAGLDHLTDAEYDCFHALNTAYQEKFGFPFIIAVKDHDKSGILAAFERRLAHEPVDELAAGLAQVSRIAEIRLADIIAG
jgi:2-oxo-4-hydroxy-4-carboxy-5-ureidoimidazoline decarboxylase